MMSTRALLFAALVSVPLLTSAQPPELRLPSFEHLRDRATDSVDITLGRWPIAFASLFIDEDDPHDAEVKRVLKGVTSIRVQSYKFDSDFEYDAADVEAVRQQLHQAGWNTLVQVRDRNQRTAVDVCIAHDGTRPTAIAVVATKPREFVIVNLVGSLDEEAIARLQGHLGVPELGL